MTDDAEKQHDAPGQRDGNAKAKLGGCTGKGFMPGQSGNPKGMKPGTRSLTSTLRKHFSETIDQFPHLVKLADKAGLDASMNTVEDLFVYATIEHGLNGKQGPFKEIWDRLEGKVEDRVEHSGAIIVSWSDGEVDDD